ncbi:uncharacterized protein N7482_002381 [Penicillium canariense]|uniref:Inositolphosphotransferase Aur1/Ipt1 domain-containing protein n=1 Tax=Penicillium canariense TaxID=189055 RepID=A0A9W9IHQ4_9EURO|nr:uncharacterized protein N7482_002381 [Penicillium canariense]KAJ5176504.1 hypothetical protein N7482_002381 [Penicillium canariense]
MGILKDILEPGAITAIFTLGAWIDRHERLRDDVENDSRMPLLKEDDCEQEQDPNEESEENEATNAPKCRPRPWLHSRVLARYPFVLEIGKPSTMQFRFYHWNITSMFDIELSTQQFILTNAPWLNHVLASIYYSHIVVGVGFFIYCYTCLPHNRYQAIRRTLALMNVLAFVALSIWRCKPPRLLPEDFGFVDVLHRGNSGSAWMRNKFQLTIAAMPSLHFGNSVLIAFCLVAYSPYSILRVIAPLWPVVTGWTVVATANHFILDMVVGVAVIVSAYRFNGAMLVLLPLERVLCRLIRLEKPRYA